MKYLFNQLTKGLLISSTAGLLTILYLSVASLVPKPYIIVVSSICLVLGVMSVYYRRLIVSLQLFVILSFINFILLIIKYGHLDEWGNNINSHKTVLIVFIVVIGIITLEKLGVLTSATPNLKELPNTLQKKKRYKYKEKEEPNPWLYLIAILCVLWTIPALVIIWTNYPGNNKKIIQIGTFFISLIIGTIYYIKNKKSFPTPADKITYFSAVVLGPAGIVQFLI